MASVLEEVTPDYAVTEVAQVAFSDADTMFDAVTIFDAVTFAVCEAVTVFHAITFAVLETIMVFAFIAVVQLAAVALRKTGYGFLRYTRWWSARGCKRLRSDRDFPYSVRSGHVGH